MKPSHLSSQSRVSTIAVVLCIVIGLLVPSSARATSITLAFSGTYDTDPGQVFGECQNGEPWPPRTHQ